jgi:hypothetical protein
VDAPELWTEPGAQERQTEVRPLPSRRGLEKEPEGQASGDAGQFRTPISTKIWIFFQQCRFNQRGEAFSKSWEIAA